MINNALKPINDTIFVILSVIITTFTSILLKATPQDTLSPQLYFIYI